MTIKVALAGAGAFGIKHLDAIKLIDGVEVRRFRVTPEELGLRRATTTDIAVGDPEANAEAVHFNALSGLDRWREVAGMMVLGRTLPAPLTVERLAAALKQPFAHPATMAGRVGRCFGLQALAPVCQTRP